MASYLTQPGVYILLLELLFMAVKIELIIGLFKSHLENIGERWW
jgi:hypothetical protein